MQVQKILENLDKFPLIEIEEDSWNLSRILYPIYGRALGFEEYDYEVRSVINQLEGLEVRTVFDFDHDSDEQCYVRIVSYSGQPFALVHMFGDRADSTASVIHPEAFTALGKQLAAALGELRLQKQLEGLENASEKPVTALSELSNWYLTWQSDELGAFSFDSPGWTYCNGHTFLGLAQNYDCVAQDEHGGFHQIEKFVSFLSRELVQVTTREGSELTVDGRRIVFFLLRQKDPIASAQALVPNQTGWKVSCVITRCQINITQYLKGQLGAITRSYVIHNAIIMREFLTKHGTQLNEGVFSSEGRDFDKLRV